MNRRDFIQSIGLGLAAASAVPVASAQNPPRPKRNILLYVADDLGMNDAGCYGNPVIKTPSIDALARQGARMSSAFCTTPSCSPSRSVLLTGRHNHANGQYGLQHSYHHFASFPDMKSLPVYLAEAGYRTASAGKFHVAPEDVYRFQSTIAGPSPREMADNCKAIIADKSDAPFFLYFCTNEPHRPFKRDGSDVFDPATIPVPNYLPDIPECREELAAYYGSVQRADSGLGRLMEILRETGHWDDTLIVFLSDNGIPFPGAKTNVYDPGIHLPCVVRNPYEQRDGAVCNAMVSWTDITPTILDFAGVKADTASFHGRSFLNALKEDNPSGWDEIYCSHTFHEVTMYYPMRVARNRKYKLIFNIAHGLEFPFASDLYQSKTWQAILKNKETRYGKRSVDALLHRPRFELYDLENNPDEIHNLVDDPEHRHVFTELQEKLKRFQTDTKDPWVLKWDRE